MSPRDCETYLEPLVLQNALDGCVLVRGRQFGLEDDAERPIADDLALGILEIPRFARDAVLHFLADEFCNG